jgi:hypothetical protein
VFANSFLLFSERPDSPLHIFKSPSFAAHLGSLTEQDFPYGDARIRHPAHAKRTMTS